ncbi:NAD(P)/FAD-dependent oxidoreductase [Plastoroseomonas hellenica]|uniref:NAD(P)/FAD-dependent oxidoreductase n=1 Tax=Plastoroseomonas hellenica TaxID=2687306 RepID=UPI001BAD9E79|nr:NAD(P)/FAD-dependent oxidoreductase [Plastoroseomonas hellenica]MBR0641555.1 NAD(P)/FAD-dependent oxidoreductase [Plastoroseomonas hellenica]
MRHDAIVIGGSFAGLAAALQLARARRRVLVIDAGQPRNRFAAAAHGIFGHDGKPPRALREEAMAQLLAYPTATVIAGEAVAARPAGDGFVVALADGGQEEGARLILATGVAEEFPPIPGMRERWGATVLHCPYCHGYEVRDRALGVIAAHPLSAHQAMLIPDWGPTTYFTQAEFEPDAEQAAQLEARGVRIERTPVVELLGRAPALEGARLADGRVVPLEALFTATRTRIASPIAAQLGCGFEEGPLGPHLRVDEKKCTTVAGVYAAGDAASPMHNATFAMAAGVMAGVGAHHSLVAGQRAAA